MRNYARQKSAFCSKKRVFDAVDNLLANADFKYIFVSYNNEGLMRLDTLKEIMSRYGTYSCFKKTYKRFKAAKNKHCSAEYCTTEYLHCLIK